jgi:hypothetical protein
MDSTLLIKDNKEQQQYDESNEILYFSINQDYK